MQKNQLSNFDIKLLKIYKSVVESGGLSAAETELNIGRSTISKYISDLEYRLGLRLCNRGPGGFSVTDEGKHVLDAFDKLTISLENFRSEVNEINNTLVGTLRVSLFDQSASNPNAHLSRAISSFSQVAPDVHLELSIETPNAIEAQVIDGRIDVGIVAIHKPSSSFEYAPIYSEDMYLYCGKHHPFFNMPKTDFNLDKIRSARYAGISFSSPNFVVGQQLKLISAAKVQSKQALAILILSGQYIGFLPDHLAIHFVENKDMKAIMTDEIYYKSNFAAIIRKRPSPNRLTRVFIEILKNAHQK